MIRRDCLELMAPLMTDQLVLSSQSGQRIEWFHLSQHEGNLLVGMMGCATGVGMGLALALPHRRVIVLESDGSVLLSLFNLPTLGNLNLSNLTVFVFDNEVYSGSTMSEPTATAGKTDLEAIARASGIENAVTVHDIEGFKEHGLPGRDRRGAPLRQCARWRRASSTARSRAPTSIWRSTSTGSFATSSAPRA